MVISGENASSLARPTNLQGVTEMGTRKFGLEIKHKRRALSEINQNFIGAQLHTQCVNKKDLSKKHQISEKIQPNPVHQPLRTRVAEKSDPSVQNITIFEDVAIEDVEELNTKDQMEIDTEGVFEETIMNIDSSDEKNPLAAVDYVDDLYAYYRKFENCICVSPNYMAQQCDINENMRAILIDWLIEVHHKFDLRDETLFLTVNIIDRFLAQKGVVRKKLQLVGLVALLLACKYEEVSVPIIDDLIYISDKAYTRKEILDTEKLMLNTLQFNMSVPTVYVFMNRYLKAAQSDSKLELLSFFFIELCLVEYKMLNFAPSFLAAAAIYTAQCTLFGFKRWSTTCEWYSSYSEDQLQECSKLIVSFHKKAATGRLTGVHRKYSTSKFGYTSKCEPADYLLDIQSSC